MQDQISEIQNWYQSNCNGDWEHQYGVEIGTLDNPGWRVRIDLVDTEMAESAFKEVSRGVGEQSESESNNWYRCWVESQTFHGAGGPQHLSTILGVFLDWVEGPKLTEVLH